MIFSFRDKISKGSQGFTLTEMLLTLLILAIIMAAMIPLIGPVYKGWNIGERKTELQQNGRVGLDMMTRYIRQAKRITGIPASGSGDFLKMRNPQDTQTYIFYHNVASSPYYIGNSGLISDGDLVGRIIDIGGSSTDLLLAKSLDSLTFDFKDSTGSLVTSPGSVDYIDISMTLSDPQGLIPDTIDLFTTVSLRPGVRINKPVWVATSGNVIELSKDIWVTSFSSPSDVSVNSSTGECWVGDMGNSLIGKVSPTGVILLTTSDIRNPESLSVNSNTGECWAADSGRNRIKKFSATGVKLVDERGFRSPASVSVNRNTGECWVADTRDNSVKKLSSNGNVLVDRSGFNRPGEVSVNISTGECWVADTNNNRIKKLSPTGTVLVNLAGAGRPQSVSVNPNTGECWVADTNNNRIGKLSSTGGVLALVTGFSAPTCVSVDSSDGSCWVADTGNDQVVKLDPDGNEEFRISGFQSPLSVSCSP